MHTLGIDIGGSAVKVACLTHSGQWLKVTSNRYTNPTRDELTAAIQECLAKLDIQNPSTVGFCLPGRMNPAKTCIDLSTNLPVLNDWAFTDLCSSVFGQSTPNMRVVSDADAAGYDFATDLLIQGRTAAISIGTGVGLSVLDECHFVTIGSTNSSTGVGHIGDMDIGRFGDTDRINAAGTRNTPESYLGTAALQDWFTGTTLDLSTLTQSDPPIQALVQTLRIIHAIFLPNRIALLGGIGLAFKPHRRLITDLVNDQLTHLADQSWSLDFATTSYHAARGAAKLAAQDS